MSALFPPPVPITTSTRSVRRIVQTAVLVVSIAAIFIAACYWRFYRYPQPPLPNLKDMDREVVEIIQGTRAAVQKSPGNCETWGNLGAVYQIHDFPDAARQCWDVAERLAPRDPRWPYLCAISLMDDDQEKAMVKLRKSVANCGDIVPPLLRLAETLMERGETDEAQALFFKVLEQQTATQFGDEKRLNQARARLGLGQLALARDNERGALDFLKQAVEGAPLDKTARLALARVHRRLGNEEDAAREVQKAATLPEGHTWPDPWAVVVLRAYAGLKGRSKWIDVLENSGQVDKAIEAARKAVLRYPDSGRAHRILGKLLNKTNQFIEAEPILRESVRLDPKQTSAHVELGFCQHNLGTFPEAIESYRRAIDIDPNAPIPHFGIALSLLSMKDEMGAIDEFQIAIRCRPAYVEARLMLAEIFFKQGKIEESKRQLEDVMRLAPKDQRPRKFLLEILGEQKID